MMGWFDDCDEYVANILASGKYIKRWVESFFPLFTRFKEYVPM
jgi:hypothetical protein